ncbi:transmembrane protein 108 isoform X1 [Alligator sinensis]|uniref:Transmembrane protein 108 isoform X1 n=1 Tax=Alligator sinensis TaxID=38654 RepID=A0A1U8D8F3_ALLSI|nr:transmembrane protein 108 isoform X1 [Alligator sinensis]XP_006020693.1 transmembrane protein 108 isoform X1 [Alligator sinensis]XP_006020694.1 transmembrane protein 108 isoform X1 [Alligator sinensis]XP_006020698.1 transmembrane protein 108 isoform X1 [Alligator sinensis]XP_014374004.1 transmembrane protein 108 isoform X1 [Alligator sinensis]XP_025056043.1 transmembrane protein 108 isoform X1 [Alligator sinensis]XP_025056044.1 transmembrane protein 108 isoform X1 [Alligator sinensis]XP_0
MKRSLQVLYCQLFSVLLILALTEELVFAVQVLSPSISSSQGLLMDTTTMTAMGTTPQHKDLHTREPIPTHAIPHSINPMENPTPSIGQNPATSSHRGGKKETYHLYNQSALYSGQTHPKGKIFQIFKGNFTESSEPYLKTALHSPFPTLRSPFTNHRFQSQTATFSDPKSSEPATTTDLDSSLHNDTLEGLNKAEQGNGTQLVMQKTNFTTPTARPLPDPETVSVPFKPTYYDIWDILKNNSWVTLNAGTSVPLFTSPGTEPAAASGQSVQAGIDVSVSSPAMGNPKGTSTTQQATTNSTAFIGVVSTAPTTRLSSSISTAGSTATGNFLNRLVPAGTWKPGVPGNISHVTEGDKPQHRATICLSKMDIAWIILAISVPISSCSVLLTVCCMRRKKKTSNPENNLSYWNNAITMDYFNRHAVELPREIQSLETSEDHLSEPRSPANGDYRDSGMVLVNPFCQETLFVGHEQVSEI